MPPEFSSRRFLYLHLFRAMLGLVVRKARIKNNTNSLMNLIFFSKYNRINHLCWVRSHKQIPSNSAISSQILQVVLLNRNIAIKYFIYCYIQRDESGRYSDIIEQTLSTGLPNGCSESEYWVQAVIAILASGKSFTFCYPIEGSTKYKYI